MFTGIFELAIISIIAAFLGILARFLKQPVILAYILTGVLLGFLGIFQGQDSETLKLLSELGIMFVLFLIGLEINYSAIRSVGKTAFWAGIGQILFTSFIGYMIARSFSFEWLPALYIGIALTFSSTIIVVKLLTEKKSLGSLYGKISVGILLVQDFLAIIILFGLSSLKNIETNGYASLWYFILKGVLVFATILWLGRKILPRIFDWISRSQELLFVSSLAWCLLVAITTKSLGFSIEMGGFLAGLALANSSERFQISSNIRPIRDFFILIFFTILGSSFTIGGLAGTEIGLPLLIFSGFVLIGNPIIVFLIMTALGYRKKTSFLCGITMAQVSEFSLILVATGQNLGHLDHTIVNLISGVAIITIALSSYLMLYGEKITDFLSPLLSIFEKKVTKEKIEHIEEKKVILIGFHRIGQTIAKSLPKNEVLIIDFNPDIIKKAENDGYSYVFGNASDQEIFDHINLDAVELIVSTSPNIEDNALLLSRINHLKKRYPKIQIIVTTRSQYDIDKLYKNGADYVFFPHLTSGNYLGEMIANDRSAKFLSNLKEKDLKIIEEALS